MPNELFVSKTDWLPSPRTLADGKTVFAIGDIHGCYELMMGLAAAIRSELSTSEFREQTVIFVGDYIDRGPDSIGVLTALAEGIDLGGAQQVFLAGNHDQFLIDILDANGKLDGDFVWNWLENGGYVTLESLGIPVGRPTEFTKDSRLLQQALRDVLSDPVRDFLRKLAPYHRIDDLVFVHAGIDPDYSLEDQEFLDMILIREPFLSSDGNWNHSFVVVHGHTPARPAVHTHRISVDSGAFVTGGLTAAQFCQEKVRFLTVSSKRNNDWLGKFNDISGVEYSDAAPLVL